MQVAATASRARLEWDLFRNRTLAFMERYDAILCPACAFPAIPRRISDDGDRTRGFSSTKTYNLTGCAIVVVRCGATSDGLPIGGQVVASPWREDMALAIAAHLEQVFGGRRQPPSPRADRPAAGSQHGGRAQSG